MYSPSWLQSVYWLFWSNVALLIGSVLWLASPLWCWFDNEPAGCGYLAFAASLFLFCNGSFSMMDWWASRASGEPMLYAGGVQAADHSSVGLLNNRDSRSFGQRVVDFLERRDWYLWTNLTFFLGAGGDIITNSLDSWILPDNEEAAAYSDIVATHLWVLSGLCGLVNWYFQQRAREFHNAPYQFTMVPSRVTPPTVSSSAAIAKKLKQEKSTSPIVLFNWFGWGDWFFLPGGLCYASGAYICFYSTSNSFCWGSKTAAAAFYLIDAMFYWPDLFRKKEHPEYYTTIPPSTYRPNV